MPNLCIRITDHATGFDQTIDFAPRHPGALLSSSIETIREPDDGLVPADPFEMAEALAAISLELGCDNTLDDMLHSIDRLRPPSGPRLVDNGDGTVTDTVNRLMWSKATLCAKEINQSAATQLCADLDLAGHAGWRIPSRIELLTLVDDTRSKPAIDTTAFPDTRNDWYWTGTEYAAGSSGAWIVGFNGGHSDGCHRDSSGAFVRAVRSLPAGQ